MTTDQRTAQQRHQTALNRIDQQTATVTNMVLVAHQAGLPDRDTHAAALLVLQGRRRILGRHAPAPLPRSDGHVCFACCSAPWPCADWTDAACEDTP